MFGGFQPRAGIMGERGRWESGDARGRRGDEHEGRPLCCPETSPGCAVAGPGAMADGGAGSPARAAPARRIGLRLALAFVAVAFAAIAVLAGLTAAFAAADVSQLANRQDSQFTSAIAAAGGAARSMAGDWAEADLAPVLDLAARVGADAQVRDTTGRVIAATPGFQARPGRLFRSPVMVHGQQVGTVAVRFTGSGVVGGASQALLAALWRAIAGAAAVAALIALLTALGVARRITRPVERLIDVARAVGRGDRTARVGSVRAPGELRELANTFDQMADTLDREDQLRRNLVADVAHELRTPLAALLAGHEALLDGVTQPTPAGLASLRDEVLQLSRMVGDLQTLAGAQAEALHLDLTHCDLAQVAADAVDSLAGRFEAGGVTVERRLSPAEVIADPGRLHQVITNLLTNSLKFTAAGGRVTVVSWPAGDQARLQVSDTGIGIPADEVPHIFNRFWRGRQASAVAGSGLGLAVAAELAAAHGGRLDASSQPGRGTTITLTLPSA